MASTPAAQAITATGLTQKRAAVPTMSDQKRQRVGRADPVAGEGQRELVIESRAGPRYRRQALAHRADGPRDFATVFGTMAINCGPVAVGGNLPGVHSLSSGRQGQPAMRRRWRMGWKA